MRARRTAAAVGRSMPTWPRTWRPAAPIGRSGAATGGAVGTPSGRAWRSTLSASSSATRCTPATPASTCASRAPSTRRATRSRFCSRSATPTIILSATARFAPRMRWWSSAPCGCATTIASRTSSTYRFHGRCTAASFPTMCCSRPILTCTRTMTRCYGARSGATTPKSLRRCATSWRWPSTRTRPSATPSPPPSARAS